MRKLMNNSKFTNYNSHKNAAFTLAEVLITLGIIGVVAVLTLPNLMSDYRKKSYVAQLQRVYNQIQNAAQNCMADEDVDDLNDTYLKNLGDDDEAYTSSAGRFLKKYFRVTKDCGFTDKDDCLAEAYKGIDGAEGDVPSGYCVNVNTGATICMNPFGENNTSVLDVDTNGKSGPNTWGRDVFKFHINGRGDLSESFSANRADDCQYGVSDNYGRGCFDKIISDGWKMDY